MRFDGYEIRYAFNELKSRILSIIFIDLNIVREWCRKYCNEHWHDENIDWNVSSETELVDMLNKSSYHNPLNLGLLKFIAGNLNIAFGINSIKNYEEEFSSNKIEDLDFVREITIFGNNISRRESTLVVNTLLGNEVTIGQLWNCCTLRLTSESTLILNASEPLMELYHSIKVCTVVSAACT